jgi:hypothetical protein
MTRESTRIDLAKDTLACTNELLNAHGAAAYIHRHNKRTTHRSIFRYDQLVTV